MTDEARPLFVRKFSSSMTVSADDLAFAEEMREHERRLAAMTPEEHAEAAQRRERERAERASEAQADWQAVRERLAGDTVAVAVLGLHRPQDTGTFAWTTCAHCQDGADGDPAEWPCDTFTAVREA